MKATKLENDLRARIDHLLTKIVNHSTYTKQNKVIFIDMMSRKIITTYKALFGADIGPDCQRYMNHFMEKLMKHDRQKFDS